MTNKLISKPAFLICIAAPALPMTASILLASGGHQELASAWRNQNIIIDGDTGEWGDHTFYLDCTSASAGANGPIAVKFQPRAPIPACAATLSRREDR